MQIDECVQLSAGDGWWRYQVTRRHSGPVDQRTLQVTVHRGTRKELSSAVLEVLDPVHLRWNELRQLPEDVVFYCTPGPDVTDISPNERDARRRAEAGKLADSLFLFAIDFIL